MDLVSHLLHLVTGQHAEGLNMIDLLELEFFTDCRVDQQYS